MSDNDKALPSAVGQVKELGQEEPVFSTRNSWLLLGSIPKTGFAAAVEKLQRDNQVNKSTEELRKQEFAEEIKRMIPGYVKKPPVEAPSVWDCVVTTTPAELPPIEPPSGLASAWSRPRESAETAQPNDEQQAGKGKAQREGADAVRRLVEEIKTRAVLAGEEFDPMEAPGTLADFTALANAWGKIAGNCARRLTQGKHSIGNYRAGIIKFVGGRPDPLNKCDFYRRLFPELSIKE